MASLVHSFPPVAAPDARLLILGSMPGIASLDAGQYYAHPRNAFWPIMGELFGAGPDLPYQERCGWLSEAGIAVWDVLRACRREGSLDAAIDRDSELPNAIPQFLLRHTDVRLVAFNGQKAETAFRRHVRTELTPEVAERIELVRLPSTSPAHAGRSFESKLAEWRLRLI